MIGSEKIVLMYNNAMRTFWSAYRYKWKIGTALIEAWEAELKRNPFVEFESDPKNWNLMGLPVDVDYERKHVIEICISTDS